MGESMQSFLLRWVWMALPLLIPESMARRSAVYEWENPQVGTSLGHLLDEVAH